MTEVSSLLEKANENISAAQLLLSEDHPDIAVSRAYYAMFYIAEALLFSRGLAFSSHSAVIAAYGKEFAKTNQLNPKFHRFLIQAFETRQISDYEIGVDISSARAAQIIQQAHLFLEAAQEFLKIV